MHNLINMQLKISRPRVDFNQRVLISNIKKKKKKNS